MVGKDYCCGMMGCGLGQFMYRMNPFEVRLMVQLI